MSLRTDVVALYVDPRGPYPGLVADWYDEQRDARTYTGSLPVVAHPPCGPWGRMRGLCRYQDPACGLHAVETVRRVGGVLEHPEDSRLFAATGMPRPGAPRDRWGGYTLRVEQVAWGHPCRKPTWLYCVGLDWFADFGGWRVGGTPTHRITSGPRGSELPSATRRIARLTPPAFASWLVERASRVFLGVRCAFCERPQLHGSKTCDGRKCVELAAWGFAA